jgi:hypothetical protein
MSARPRFSREIGQAILACQEAAYGCRSQKCAVELPIPEVSGPVVSRLGDLWLIGRHKLLWTRLQLKFGPNVVSVKRRSRVSNRCSRIVALLRRADIFSRTKRGE